MTLIRPQFAFRALSLCLILHTASDGQTLPAVTADSGQFRMHPLVPAAGEPIGLSATGEFGFSNAEISVEGLTVEPELITIDLATAWNAGTSTAADAVTTPWSFEKLTVAQADERMNSMYAELLNGWAEFGGHMNLYNDSLPLGSFGIVSRWDQPVETAHRYQAVLDFLVTDPPGGAPVRLGDGDGDGDIDLDDFSLFSDVFQTSDARFDFNTDGRVDFNDLFLFADVFGT